MSERVGEPKAVYRLRAFDKRGAVVTDRTVVERLQDNGEI
jgi:hypothetical protein